MAEGARMSIVGNVAIKGSQSKAEYLVAGHKRYGWGWAYMKDNIIVDRTGRNLQLHDRRITPLSKPPIWSSVYTVRKTTDSLYEVMRTVGPRPGERDPETL